MKTAVILGGTSAERDVSFSTGVAVSRALQKCGHTVLAIDCAFGDSFIDIDTIDTSHLVKTTPPDIEKRKSELNRNLLKTVDRLLAEKVDVVFNALHGGYGENGQIQALLDIAGIPYTGSGTVSSAVGMDKHLSKILFRANDVPTADWLHLTRKTTVSHEAVEKLGLPFVVKPNAQGSTVGLTIVNAMDELDAAIQLAFEFDESVLIEQFVPGRELTVAILGNRTLPIVEIVPKSGIYDYESKYQSGRTEYHVPADLPESLAAAIQEAGLRTFSAIQCAGYARADFRLRTDGTFSCLEINTLPGMTATSLVPKAAKAAGISFEALITEIIDQALAV
ncbi:MAG: D-alanine--D-alanine ligase [Calditrichaeota bacterium]|nr:D-alanine--D-alanine ligase [Calditrichota bacterium]MCB0269225.1 D-alanine--D-alanine ligase [Calditrichota bacterium]MCB9068972.1 D-alanine--D-alanine ligase [Calditrichia bacterium]